MKLRTPLILVGILAIVVGCTTPAASPSAAAPAESPSAAAASPSEPAASAAGGVVKATPGQSVKMMLLPKFLGILPFDQANTGAEEAATELANPEKLEFVGPTAENSVQGQIEFMTNAPTQGTKVVMLSNNAGDQIAPAAEAAQAAGTKVVTWDSPTRQRRARACSWRRSTSTRSAS